MRDTFLKLALVSGVVMSLALVAVPSAARAHGWDRGSDRDRDWHGRWESRSREDDNAWQRDEGRHDGYYDEDGDSDEGDEDSKVENARSAAPASVSDDAAVLDWPGADGAMPELAEGSNGWTCLPDYPASPGNDPMCLDETSMEWMEAYMARTSPNLSQLGIAYMLQGSSDASNTDPFAQEPAPGEDWGSSPPHIMIFPAGDIDEDVYGTDPDSGRPWVMFAGTPYEHFMIPVE